ncbi:hypothetical protein CLV32_4075 [Pedobacter duraquae]|uniref:Uncharacterized protein n=1 Tax=Pedobacter duraquae TaxID=425511 RepID=A0A4R6IH30_9SPHI|nr:hypothetical protein CLV32_4075 [Pedobacter duraquae]
MVFDDMQIFPSRFEEENNINYFTSCASNLFPSRFEEENNINYFTPTVLSQYSYKGMPPGPGSIPFKTKMLTRVCCFTNLRLEVNHVACTTRQ